MLAFPTIPIGNREGHFAATRATSVSGFVPRRSFTPTNGSRISSLILVVIAHIASFYLLALSPAREIFRNQSILSLRERYRDTETAVRLTLGAITIC